MYKQAAFFYKMSLLNVDMKKYAIGQNLKIKAVSCDQMKLPANRLWQNNPARFIDAQFCFHAIKYAKWHY